MTQKALHLIKLCVGARTITDLRERQSASPYHITRIKPKRSDEILAGHGSLYWVIQRQIICRQRILDFETVTIDGIEKCKFVFDATIVPVVPRPRGPFQGWRYLEVAPDDLPHISLADGDIPLPYDLSLALSRYGVR